MKLRQTPVERLFQDNNEIWGNRKWLKGGVSRYCRGVMRFAVSLSLSLSSQKLSQLSRVYEIYGPSIGKTDREIGREVRHRGKKQVSLIWSSLHDIVSLTSFLFISPPYPYPSYSMEMHIVDSI